MKKFLLYLLILVVITSFIGVVFYLSRNDEYLNASTESFYLNVGEIVDPQYDVDNVKRSTKIEILSSDENVIKIEDNKLNAVAKGTSVISISLTNAKGKSMIIQQTVAVGDGSSEVFPFYIRNELDLGKIGEGKTYGSNKYYAQVADITLTKEFETINGTFSGNYNGKGFCIIDYKSTGAKETSAMFNEVNENGSVSFIKFKNVNIEGTYDCACVVAKVNKGLIDYIETDGKIFNKSSNGISSGIVGKNENASGLKTAQVQRCVNKIQIKTNAFVVGGIVGVNSGIVTACQNGDSSLNNPVNSDFIFTNPALTGAISGGIVGKNINAGEETMVSNSYSINQVIIEEGVVKTDNYFGGVIGVDYNRDEALSIYEIKKTSYIFGNYYLILTENDVVNKGIGNITRSIPDDIANIYIANGLPYSVFSSSENSILVSYATSFSSGKSSLTSWPTNVWIVDNSIFPYLTSMEEVGFVSFRLDVDLPRSSIGAEFEIPNADKFILYAQSGVFTNTENTGKTYSLTGSASDFDFNGKSFIMTGCDEKPVCVNLKGEFIDGAYPVLSNLNISQSTKAILENLSELTTVNEALNVGLFGVVSDAKLENIQLKNCKFNDGSLTNVENIGGIAGKAKNSSFYNCAFTSEKTNGVYTSTILCTSITLTAGGIVGKCENTTIRMANVDVEIACISEFSHDKSVYIGGVVGKLGGETEMLNIQNKQDFNNANMSHVEITTSKILSSNFDGKIDTILSNKIYSGACAGLVDGAAVINGFVGSNVVINSNYSGGIAAIVKGIVEQSRVKTTLHSNYAGGFVYSLPNVDSRVYNCYCETIFTLESASVNAGIACEVVDGCLFSQCVNYNNFQNNSSSAKNYAKIKQDVKFDFDCNNKITELNFYSENTPTTSVILHNCFYVNLVNGVNSNDYNLVKFYTQTGQYETWLGTANYVDEKVILWITYNGSVRNGRMLSTGGLAQYPNTDTTWADFGFKLAIWYNSDKIIGSENLLYQAIQ